MTLTNASMDDKLDALYFRLPIGWGDGRLLAAELGVNRRTIGRWLHELEAEGLVKHVGMGYWVECFDWAEELT